MSSRFTIRGLLVAALVAGATTLIGQPAEETYTHACDGSAVVAVGDSHFLTASDEDNVIRLYKRGAKGAPLNERDLTTFLRPEMTKRGRAKEADIEAVATIGDRLYWIGSHGNDKEGDIEISRNRLFATTLKGTGAAATIDPIGKPYTNLHAAFDTLPTVGAALGPDVRKLRPDRGGINIEGMAGWGSSLAIGFRSPLVNGKALVLRLTNPADVVDKGAPPAFAEPLVLDLGGLGIRAIEPMANAKDAFWILAGAVDARAETTLYEWRVGAEPRKVKGPSDLGPGEFEGLMTDGATLFASRDTGVVGGADCSSVPIDQRLFTLVPVVK